MARKYKLHLFQFCSSVIATIFYCLAVAFFASPGLYFFIIIAQKFFIFSAMFYYSFAIVCLLLSKLFSKKTALIMTFGFMILCVAFFGATDSIEFYVINLFNRDFLVIQAYVLLMAVLFVLCNLAMNIYSALVDPRLREGGLR